MNLFSFSYLVAIYFFFALFTNYNDLDVSTQVLYTSALILLFGVPHGALDNILYVKEKKISKLNFYIQYLSIIVLYSILWFIAPKISMLLFLLVSAFHFGESHFSDYKIKLKYKKIFYFIWGIFLLSALLFFNRNELINLSNNYIDTTIFIEIYSSKLITPLFYFSLLTTLFTLIFITRKNMISKNDLFSEIFQIGLIILTFYILPILIGFTLYFIFIHSFRSLYQEYNYLKKNNLNLNLFKFIKLLLPHTLISFIFIVLIFSCSFNNIINISPSFLAIIIISTITLPHTFVMSNFLSK